MKRTGISFYQLWFKHGAKHKMSIMLLTHLLLKAGMVELVEYKGERRCELKETSAEAIYRELKKYSQLAPWSQLYIYFQAVRTWKRKTQPELSVKA